MTPARPPFERLQITLYRDRVRLLPFIAPPPAEGESIEQRLARELAGLVRLSPNEALTLRTPLVPPAGSLLTYGPVRVAGLWFEPYAGGTAVDAEELMIGGGFNLFPDGRASLASYQRMAAGTWSLLDGDPDPVVPAFADWPLLTWPNQARITVRLPTDEAWAPQWDVLFRLHLVGVVPAPGPRLGTSIEPPA